MKPALPPIRGLMVIGALFTALMLVGPIGEAKAGGGCTPSSFDYAGAALPIPDPGAAEAPVPVPAGPTVEDLEVRLEISHPFDSDLTIELVSPSGGSIVLAEAVGTWGDDFTATRFDDEAGESVISELPPFTGSFRPAEALEAFDRTARGGTWKLRVTDRHGGYDGSIEEFSLDLGCEDVVPPGGGAVSVSSFQRDRSVQVGWAAGADAGTGVASRDVHYFRAPHRGGFGNPVRWRSATTATFGGLTGDPGATYCFAERLRDGAGNVTAFSSQRCTAVPINDSALEPTGRWRRRTGPGHYTSDYSQAKRRGASLSIPVVGSGFALLAATCRRCGRVKVFLDSQLLKRVSLKSRRKRMRKRRLIQLGSFGAPQTGELRIVIASRRRRVIIDGIGVVRPPVAGLPDTYERIESAGAPPLPALPESLPAGAEEPVGSVITVDADTDDSDGDVTSVSNLMGSRGPDGKISIREVIDATNNDPGQYTVHFAPALSGETIGVTTFGLPQLLGGGLFIDGDIDGDGDPDVEIEDQNNHNFGFVIDSDDNRIHALEVTGFASAAACVCLQFDSPVPTGETYANNTFDGLVSDSGLILSGSGQGTTDTDNRILDARLVGNTLNENAIGFALFGTTGDRIERTTIAGNEIHPPAGSSSFGVNVSAGNGADSEDNLVSEALVAYNSIDGNPEAALRVTAEGFGTVPGVGNTTEQVRLIANRADLDPLRPDGFGTTGILIQAGDEDEGAEDATTRQIEVSGNLLEGHGAEGVRIMAACCDSTGDRIEDVMAVDNVIHGELPPLGGKQNGVAIVGSGGASDSAPLDNQVSGVGVHRNDIQMDNLGGLFFGELNSGGITVLGGEVASGNAVTDVEITDNRIATDLVGLNIVGGWALPTLATQGNQISGVVARFNLIEDPPSLLAGSVPGIRAVSAIGGTGGIDPGFGPWVSMGNAVSCIILEDNLVAGLLDDFSLMANVASGDDTAADNAATLGGC